ncbi:RpiR family transcriptional regulator [Aureimonas endophytica]|uniref:RpiR family transcriptional regulator n=1 Tax=Aureimonas endophytica TaxID=2027858 RepID=A0A916ZP44_9HYPH|nr:MurR/RpiR family transcriptional regulator [Aureimonas endophytica]GGE05166.1 RpiR family transcriptional regulator [Aureimonas endophytica]
MEQSPLTDRILKGFEAMSSQLQAAARHVLDHPRDVALLSMREQARRAGVQPATMTRLAKHLGFEGFEEIRALHADVLRERDLGFAGKAGAQVTSQKQHGDKALAGEMLRSAASQIERLGQDRTLERIVAAAETLASARRVYSLGLRSSHPVAWHLHYVLTLLGERSILLDGIAGTGADGLATATGEDVLFVASVAPYTRLSVELAEHAAALGLRVVAVTDSAVAPLAQMAAQAVIVPTDTPSFFHTMTPAFLVAEILATLIAGKAEEGALEALRRMDGHLAALDTHLKPSQTRKRK